MHRKLAHLPDPLRWEMGCFKVEERNFSAEI